MIELEVNGYTVDLSKQLIAITRQVIDVENPTSRRIDITNRFKLPKTQNNKQIFESADILNSDNLAMDRIYNSRLIDQSPIFVGIGFINSYNDYFYNYQLSDASKDLFDNLQDNINKLDFDDQDILFNIVNYNNIKLSSNSIWIWPIVSMHNERTTAKTPVPPTSIADLKYLRPMLNVNFIIDKLISNQGWAYTNDISFQENLCLSCNHEQFYVTSYQKTLTQSFSSPSSENITGLSSFDFEKVVSVTNTTINIGSIKTSFRFRGNIITDSQVLIVIKAVETVTLKETRQEFLIVSNQTEVDFTSKEFHSSSNHIIAEFLITSSGNFQFDNTLLYTIIEEDNFGDLSTNPLIDYKVKVYDNLPDISQLDLFKLSAILTNSIYVPDSFNKIINIKSLSNLSKLNSTDWSEKFDQKSEFVENRFSDLGQINELLYDNDDTIFADLGKDEFSIFNQSLEDVKEYLTIPFSATNDIELGGFSIGDLNIYDDTERINDINPRILYFYNDSDISPSYTLARFQELDWRNLKINYYQDWFDSLYRTRKIEGLANLTKLDVLGFDFTQLVYIEYFKSYFFVLMIEDYVPGRKTKITLLKYL